MEEGGVGEKEKSEKMEDYDDNHENDEDEKEDDRNDGDGGAVGVGSDGQEGGDNNDDKGNAHENKDSDREHQHDTQEQQHNSYDDDTLPHFSSKRWRGWTRMVFILLALIWKGSGVGDDSRGDEEDAPEDFWQYLSLEPERAQSMGLAYPSQVEFGALDNFPGKVSWQSC